MPQSELKSTNYFYNGTVVDILVTRNSIYLLVELDRGGRVNAYIRPEYKGSRIGAGDRVKLDMYTDNEYSYKQFWIVEKYEK